jgi:anti-sigma factor RsiW
MNCAELEQFLYPYLDDEFGPQERLDVETHLAGCAACAARFHEEAKFVEVVRAASPALAQQAPAGLRDRIQGGLRREQRRVVQGRFLRVSAAAAVVVALGGSLWQYQQAQAKRRFFQAAALRHGKWHPLEITQVPHEGVEAWFGGKLDHHVRIPRLANAQLIGARLSNVENKQAAYIRYDAPTSRGGSARPVGLFVFDDAARDVRAEPLPEVQVNSSHGYNVAIWRDGELVYELVSDLDDSDIRRMLTDPHMGAGPVAAPHPTRPSLPIQPAGFHQ